MYTLRYLAVAEALEAPVIIALGRRTRDSILVLLTCV